MIILQSASDIGLPAITLFTIVCFIIYFLPAIIARKHSNSVSILLVNLFFGWTFIGWVIALVWACSSSRGSVVINNVAPPPQLVNHIEMLDKLALLREKGFISEEEFQAEKKKLLA